MQTEELTLEEIKLFVSKSVDTKFSNQSLIVEAKSGFALLELPTEKYTNLSEIKLFFKRISGNGKITLNDEEYTINSKISEVISLSLSNNSIKLSRPLDSIGEVGLFGASLTYTEPSEPEVVNKWKSIVDKCGKYTGLRVINNKLLATEGGSIDNGFTVAVLSTEPSNSYYRDGESIKFTQNCEITELEINHSYAVLKKELPIPYSERKEDKPAIQVEAKGRTSNPVSIPDLSVAPNLTVTKQDFILFDTNFVSGFDSLVFKKDKLVKIIKSNGKTYVSIKRFGHITINVPKIQANENYIIMINGKKLSGNGKINLSFSTAEESFPKKWNSFFLDNNLVDKYINIKSGNESFAQKGSKLHLSVLEDGIGEVLISRILVVKDLPIANGKNLANETFYPTETPLILNNENYNKFSIKRSTRESAVVTVSDFVFNNQIVTDAIVEPLTNASRTWLSKVYPTLKGLKVKDKKNLVEPVARSTDDPDLVMGSLGNLKVGKRIYVEEFANKQLPSESDVEILKKTKTVLTSSVQNQICLKQFLTGQEVVLATKVWPPLNEYKNLDKEFFVYFEKNEELTKALCSIWLKDFPTLYVIGSTVGVPNYVKHISPYEEYPVVCNYIMNSQGVIDLSLNTNYKSGIVDFALGNGVNVLTNNMHYLTKTLDNLKVTNIEINKNKIVLDRFVLLEQIRELCSLSKNQKQSEEYLVSYKENINLLLGK